MSISILSGDNWYPAIIGSKAVEYTEGYYYILLGYVVIDVALIQARTFKKK